jgi:hypothetical protein
MQNIKFINTLLVGILLLLIGVIVGAQAANTRWRSELVKAKHAQYSVSTGTWCLRSLDDIATDGIILGKAHPEQKISE